LAAATDLKPILTIPYCLECESLLITTIDEIAPSSAVLIMSTVKRPASVLIPGSRFLTVRRVADELGVSDYTVRRLIHDGVLAGVRVG
jgi:hypothetical protein